MNVPPASPPPELPPPPPRPTSAWTWVLVGCGCLMFVGMVGVAGCFFFVSKVARVAQETVAKWEALGESHIRGNAVVEKHLGRVRSVTSRHRHSQTESPTMNYAVAGEKGEGIVVIEVDPKIAGDLLNPKVSASHLYFDGKKINLQSGQETEFKGPIPTPEEDDEDDD